MSFNLRNRSFLKELDFTPAELKFLLRLAADLKAAKYGGYERPHLTGKNIALITVDVKSPVYGSGAVLVTAVHEAFQSLPAASKPWVIYNTGDNNSESDTFFNAIAGMLTDREGMMIDGTQDPVAVYNKLGPKSRNGNIGYGSGGQGITSGSFPKVDLSVDLATWIRTSQGLKASVPYVFPITSAASGTCEAASRQESASPSMFL